MKPLLPAGKLAFCARIMLDDFSCLLRSKSCWHIWHNAITYYTCAHMHTPTHKHTYTQTHTHTHTHMHTHTYIYECLHIHKHVYSQDSNLLIYLHIYLFMYLFYLFIYLLAIVAIYAPFYTAVCITLLFYDAIISCRCIN